MRLKLILAELVPLLAAEAQLNPVAVFDVYDAAVRDIESTAADTDDPKLLDLSLKLFDNDASRRASIDTRAGLMMSAITIAATLVTGVGLTAFRNPADQSSAALCALFVTFVITLAYLTATIILIFHIQGRMFRATPDPSDLPTPQAADPSTYPRTVAVKILRYTIYNYRVNNRVINRLWVAQRCFRNALVVLIAGGIVTTVLFALPQSPRPNAARLAQAIARAAGCLDLPVLHADRKGAWSGSCLRAGKPAWVTVAPDGRAAFAP